MTRVAPLLTQVLSKYYRNLGHCSWGNPQSTGIVSTAVTCPCTGHPKAIQSTVCCCRRALLRVSFDFRVDKSLPNTLWDKTSWPLIICSMRGKNMRCEQRTLHREEHRRVGVNIHQWRPLRGLFTKKTTHAQRHRLSPASGALVCLAYVWEENVARRAIRVASFRLSRGNSPLGGKTTCGWCAKLEVRRNLKTRLTTGSKKIS